MYELATLLVSGLMGAATIVLAIFAIIQANSAKIQANAAKTQTNIMKEEFDAFHRAWIGMADKGFDDHIPNELRISYKNYGRTPAHNVKERWNFTGMLPTRDSIHNDSTHIFEQSVNLPTQERGFTMHVDQDLFSNFKNGTGSLFCWAVIEYEYGGSGQKGSYGVIGEYDKTLNGIIIRDEWVL